jgi:hypothetical protein
VHSWHFDDWAFHANGSPAPGPVLMNLRSGEDRIRFRTTAEEILTFVLALKLEAALPDVPFKMVTTQFTLVGENVILRAVTDYDRAKPWFIRDDDDAKMIVVPLVHLKDFTGAIVEREFEYYKESQQKDKDVLMAGMGAFVLLTAGRR